MSQHIIAFHLQQCVSHDFSLSLHALSHPFLSLLHSDGQLPQPTGAKRGKSFHSAQFWVKWCVITRSVCYSTHFSCYVRTCSWCICSFARSYKIQLQHRQMLLHFPEMRALKLLRISLVYILTFRTVTRVHFGTLVPTNVWCFRGKKSVWDKYMEPLVRASQSRGNVMCLSALMDGLVGISLSIMWASDTYNRKAWHYSYLSH